MFISRFYYLLFIFTESLLLYHIYCWCGVEDDTDYLYILGGHANILKVIGTSLDDKISQMFGGHQ